LEADGTMALRSLTLCTTLQVGACLGSRFLNVVGLLLSKNVDQALFHQHTWIQ